MLVHAIEWGSTWLTVTVGLWFFVLKLTARLQNIWFQNDFYGFAYVNALSALIHWHRTVHQGTYRWCTLLLNKFTVNALSLICQGSMLTVVPTATCVLHFIKALTFLYKGHRLFNQVFFPISWFKFLKVQDFFKQWTLKRLSLLSLAHSHKLKAS